jgi:hypothetical protein
MGEQGAFNAKDIAKGKINPNEITLKYIIIRDQMGAEQLSRAINKLTREGWVVKHCWGDRNAMYTLMGKNLKLF